MADHPPFPWDEASELAAGLLSRRHLNLDQIAETVGRARRTLWEWRQHPEFAARVAELTAEIRAEVRRVGIADLENRVAALNDLAAKLRRVMQDRAASEALADKPGGPTGLIVEQVRGIGKGADFQVIRSYPVDTRLLAELRAIYRHTAQELGQWQAKVETSEVDIRRAVAATEAAANAYRDDPDDDPETDEVHDD